MKVGKEQREIRKWYYSSGGGGRMRMREFESVWLC